MSIGILLPGWCLLLNILVILLVELSLGLNNLNNSFQLITTCPWKPYHLPSSICWEHFNDHVNGRFAECFLGKFITSIPELNDVSKNSLQLQTPGDSLGVTSLGKQASLRQMTHGGKLVLPSLHESVFTSISCLQEIPSSLNCISVFWYNYLSCIKKVLAELFNLVISGDVVGHKPLLHLLLEHDEVFIRFSTVLWQLDKVSLLCTERV